MKIGFSILKTELLSKHIRTVVSCNKEKCEFWNFKLPLLINKKGIIPDNYKNFVLDDLRNSFGIDLTKGLKEGNSIKNSNKELSRRIKEISKVLKDIDLPKKEKDNLSLELENAKKELIKLKSRNATYNKYEARKRNFDMQKLDKLVASFLFVTGQVIYNGKYEFIEDVGLLSKVSKSKSYERESRFNQKLFNVSFGIKSKFLSRLKYREICLSDLLEENEKALVRKEFKINYMYDTRMLSKIRKLASALKTEDVKSILKAVYQYKDNLKTSKQLEEQTNTITAIDELTKALVLYRKDKKESVTLIKKYWGKAIGKKDTKHSAKLFVDRLYATFVTREEYEENRRKYENEIASVKRKCSALEKELKLKSELSHEKK